jgi:ribose 5-phosphate isomerase B
LRESRWAQWCYRAQVRVALATDHAGFPLKAPIADWLKAAGHEVVDLGVNAPQPMVDYPDVIAPAALAVADGDCERAIVLGGSGTGEQIVANKVRGIRCVEATDPVTARLGREHNNANVLAMGARIIGSEIALGCVAAFMEGEFLGGRHARRVDKISRLEAEQASR